jgi:hypothetical protein
MLSNSAIVQLSSALKQQVLSQQQLFPQPHPTLHESEPQPQPQSELQQVESPQFELAALSVFWDFSSVLAASALAGGAAGEVFSATY